uniref:BACON domain-containing protein n=1 Tax=Segatella copri TaxID=165179 RepID=UPI0040285891
MKFKYLFIALIAVAGFFASCSDDKDLGQLDGIQLSQSSLSIPVEGGQVEFDVISAADWKFVTNDKKGNPVDSIPAWISSSCKGGSAGTTHVVFNAAATKGANNSTFKLVSGAQTQYITVIQGVLNPPFSTCAEILAGNDGETYKVKGTLTKLSNTVYGNWYIKDATGEVYVYGTLDANGSAQNFASLKLEEGDEVTIQGPRTTYGGSPQLKNVTVLSYTKSLIKVEELDKDTLDKAGEDFKVSLTVKGEGVTVDIPEADQSWLSVKGIVTSGTKAEITFHANANAGGARSSSIGFTSTKGKQSSTVTAKVYQLGSIIECPIADFNKAEKGSTVYRLTGVITKVANPTYGNCYIKDATGETFVYGIGAKGDFEKKGLKVGDVVTLTGVKDIFKGTGQMKNATLEDVKVVTKISVADFLTKKDDKNVYYMLEGTITEFAGQRNDLKTYGNFGLTDDSGSAFVYGLTTGWGGAKKLAGTLGLNFGDKITIIGYRTSHDGAPQVGGAFLFSKGE